MYIERELVASSIDQSKSTFHYKHRLAGALCYEGWRLCDIVLSFHSIYHAIAAHTATSTSYKHALVEAGCEHA